MSRFIMYMLVKIFLCNLTYLCRIKETSSQDEPVYEETNDGKPKAIPVDKFAEYVKNKSGDGGILLKEEFKVTTNNLSLLVTFLALRISLRADKSYLLGNYAKFVSPNYDHKKRATCLGCNAKEFPLTILEITRWDAVTLESGTS